MRAAWIGNSYIYYNDLPTMLAGMLVVGRAAEMVEHKQVTVGGERFAGHAANAAVGELLDEQWDVVILQDNSAVPGGSDAEALAASHAALDTFFAPRVAAVPTLLVFGSWGHRLGSVYEQHRAAYPDYATMQALTSEGCEGYARRLDRAKLVPAGAAFRRVFDLELEAGRDPLHEASLFSRLFAPDDFHPSRIGTYLACCCFYAVVSGRSPVATPFVPAAAPARNPEPLDLGPAMEPGAFEECSADEQERLARAACAAREKAYDVACSEPEYATLQKAAAWAVAGQAGS